MKRILIYFIFFLAITCCRAQTDSLQKTDSTINRLPRFDFSSVLKYDDVLSFHKTSYDWRKMSTVSYFFHDSIVARRLIQNRYMPATKTVFFYKDHLFYFDDPLQPYGRNDLPSVFIFGTLNYLFELFRE